MKTDTFVRLDKSDKLVREAIKLRGLRTTAKKIGVSASMLCRWMQGTTGMNLLKFRRLELFLEVELNPPKTW